MKNRKAITIFDDDSVITLIKPFSYEYNDNLYVIYEDAYGEIIGQLEPISELKTKFNLTDEEFNEIVINL